MADQSLDNQFLIETATRRPRATAFAKESGARSVQQQLN